MFSIEDQSNTFFGYTLSVLLGKWKLLIIYHLGKVDVIRFNELQRILGKITYKTLSTSLKELEADGIVLRNEYPQIPPKVEYSLTDKGKALLPILVEMCNWGEQYKNV